MTRERRLGARELEEIFTAFAEIVREQPPDIDAGWLDDQGELRLAPDIARKLRTARRVRELLREWRLRERELPASQIALVWMLRNPAIAAPIVGATKINHLDDAVAALSIELSSGEIDRLEEPYQPHPLPPQLA